MDTINTISLRECFSDEEISFVRDVSFKAKNTLDMEGAETLGYYFKEGVKLMVQC